MPALRPPMGVVGVPTGEGSGKWVGDRGGGGGIEDEREVLMGVACGMRTFVFSKLSCVCGVSCSG